MIKSLLINFTHEDKIIVTGDSRFDQVIQRSKNSADISFPEEFAQTNNIIFGSTLYSDLSIIETALSISSLFLKVNLSTLFSLYKLNLEKKFLLLQ